MCGIAAILATGIDRDRAEAALTAMRVSQHHRGPDDSGNYWSPDHRVGLANCRLSIRDLSPAARMPMCVDGVCITYNGEIYNADELRRALELRGHRFTSGSDTEVILRGYIEWGDAITRKLRGMFAFAVYDAPRDVLFLARDPLGIKPLYYSCSRPLCVASEIRAIAGSGLVSTELSDAALTAYLQLGSIPAPLTIYRDIRALEPGHTACIPLDAARQLETTRYWDLSTVTRESTEEDVRVALEDAVASHLVADVPVGAFLSGGLDSSTVVAIAARMSNVPIRTCSVTFAEVDHDESMYARAVARAFNTDHAERVVTREDFFQAIPEFIHAIDQPSIDGFNTFFVSRLAHELGLKVALSGLGGDELFGGYPSFTGVARVMRALRIARGISRVIPHITASDRWRKVASASQRSPSPAGALMVFRGLFTKEETRELMPGQELFDTIAYVTDHAGQPGTSLRAWVARAELGTYTASQLLRDSDATSMAHSVEMRVPLLDTHLLETLAALPAKARFMGKGNKPLLRRLMAGQLPSAVTNQRPRQGFTFPLQLWLSDPAAAYLWNWNSDVFRRFDTASLRDMQVRFQSGRAHWSRVWALMALNEWSARMGHA